MDSTTARERHDTDRYGIPSGFAHRNQPLSAGDEHRRRRIHRQGYRRQTPCFLQRIALHCRANSHVCGDRAGIHSLAARRGDTYALQKIIGKYGDAIVAPALILIGLFMLFGHRLNLPKFGFSGHCEKIGRHGSWGALLLGILFSLAFCPSSGVFYFGMLIPMAAAEPGGWFLPVVFAIATGMPVVIAAWILAYGAAGVGIFYGRMQIIRKWLARTVGMLFIAVGIYYWIIYFF